MMERRRIVELWHQGEARVLVTLVHAEGSTYRQPGARLLLAPGTYAGTISGGCLETEVARKAEWITRNGAALQRYSMLFDDAEEIPFGLGCGGIVDLLYEPADTPEARALLAALEASLHGTPSRVITFLPDATRPLRRLILTPTGTPLFASESLSQQKIDCARALTLNESHEGRYVEVLDPPQRLVLLGAGDDAKPLAALAASLGWSVTIADGRTQVAQQDRFPTADTVLITSDPAALGLRAADAVVLMTHSYEQDRAFLAGILASQPTPRYIGLLGSRHRSSLLLAEAAERTGKPLTLCCQSVHAPVGLDLGGDGPEAIALAILAEIQAFLHGRTGGSRKLTPAEVSAYAASGSNAQYLQAACAL